MSVQYVYKHESHQNYKGSADGNEVKKEIVGHHLLHIADVTRSDAGFLENRYSKVTEKKNDKTMQRNFFIA
jgi:hypothetical protein